MQDEPSVKEEQNFTTFTEEVDHIREQVTAQEKLRDAPPSPPERQEMIAQEIEKYEKTPTQETLHPNFQMQVDEIEEQVVHLSPEHDKQVDQLVAIMGEKGLKNTLAVLERVGNYHVNDDFHRFLVQYVARGLDVPGLKDGERLYRALNMRLFEVTLPEFGAEGDTRSFADLVRAMEQFYVGMMSLKESGKVTNHFTIELALSNYSDDLVFYAAVPVGQAGLFEKQLMAAFPRASLAERKEDYNPFNENGVTAASVAELSDHKGFPLKTFESFEQDPLNVMLGTFSKLNKNGEGASIQLTIAPSEKSINQEFTAALDRMKEGEVLSRAFEGTGKRVTRELFSMASTLLSTKSSQSEEQEEAAPEVNQEAIDKITEKTQTPILRTNVRLVASSGTQARAEQILSDMESAFNQFSRQQSNSFIFKRREGANLKQLLHNFTFRLFNEKDEILLNTQELTTIMHFPVTDVSTPALKTAAMMTAQAPLETPEDGIVLGVNNHRGTETEVRMGREDRVRHMYVIGQTGSGKTVFLKNMILQDIKNGDGVCFMDPHGSDIEEILGNIPEERMEDVIYFDPSDMERPLGLNMLECDPTDPQQKSFVVNEMLSIFNKLFDMKVAGGPMFEQYFRNATGLVIEDPSSGSTMLEIVRVLADEDFRKLKLSRCNNQMIKQFWEDIAGKAGGEASLANMVPYITNKFDVFLSNDIMRMMMAQEKSAFNMRDVMDGRKILLVNLAKGRLGDINSHLIGLILVGKILMAALSRVDSHGAELQDFYLYIDEFQNVTTDSISAILSEARKYRLSLNVAHQYLEQLPEDIKGAIFGNVGSKAVFRISSEDAQFLEASFAPTFSAADIMKTPNLNAYISMLVNGYPAKPFNVAIPFPPRGDKDHAEKVKQLSRQKYGQDRALVELLVAQKYESKKKAAAPPKQKIAAKASVKKAPLQQVTTKSTMTTPPQSPQQNTQQGQTPPAPAAPAANTVATAPAAATPPQPTPPAAPLSPQPAPTPAPAVPPSNPPQVTPEPVQTTTAPPSSTPDIHTPNYASPMPDKKFADDQLDENQLRIAQAPKEEKVGLPPEEALSAEEKQRLQELKMSAQDTTPAPPVAAQPLPDTPLTDPAPQAAPQVAPEPIPQMDMRVPEPATAAPRPTAQPLQTPAAEHIVGSQTTPVPPAAEPVAAPTDTAALDIKSPPETSGPQGDPYREPLQ